MTEQHPTPDTLDERDLAILQFEATWFMLDEDRHDAIRARFACSVEDYNLDLNRVAAFGEQAVRDDLLGEVADDNLDAAGGAFDRDGAGDLGLAAVEGYLGDAAFGGGGVEGCGEKGER